MSFLLQHSSQNGATSRQSVRSLQKHVSQRSLSASRKSGSVRRGRGGSFTRTKSLLGGHGTAGGAAKVSRFHLSLDTDLERVLDAYMAVDEHLRGWLSAAEAAEVCAFAAVEFDPRIVAQNKPIRPVSTPSPGPGPTASTITRGQRLSYVSVGDDESSRSVSVECFVFLQRMFPSIPESVLLQSIRARRAALAAVITGTSAAARGLLRGGTQEAPTGPPTPSVDGAALPAWFRRLIDDVRDRHRTADADFSTAAAVPPPGADVVLDDRWIRFECAKAVLCQSRPGAIGIPLEAFRGVWVGASEEFYRRRSQDTAFLRSLRLRDVLRHVCFTTAAAAVVCSVREPYLPSLKNLVLRWEDMRPALAAVLEDAFGPDEGAVHLERLYTAVSFCRRHGLAGVLRQAWPTDLTAPPEPNRCDALLEETLGADGRRRPLIEAQATVLTPRCLLRIAAPQHPAAQSPHMPPIPPLLFTPEELIDAIDPQRRRKFLPLGQYPPRAPDAPPLLYLPRSGRRQQRSGNVSTDAPSDDPSTPESEDGDVNCQPMAAEDESAPSCFLTAPPLPSTTAAAPMPSSFEALLNDELERPTGSPAPARTSSVESIPFSPSEGTIPGQGRSPPPAGRGVPVAVLSPRELQRRSILRVVSSATSNNYIPHAEYLKAHRLVDYYRIEQGTSRNTTVLSVREGGRATPSPSAYAHVILKPPEPSDGLASARRPTAPWSKRFGFQNAAPPTMSDDASCELLRPTSAGASPSVGGAAHRRSTRHGSRDVPRKSLATHITTISPRIHAATAARSFARWNAHTSSPPRDVYEERYTTARALYNGYEAPYPRLPRPPTSTPDDTD